MSIKSTISVTALLATASVASAVTISFDAGEGWTNGNSADFSAQGSNTSGITFKTHTANHVIDSTLGVLKAPSSSFVRNYYSLGGPGTPTAMDVPLLGSITLDWAFDIVGEGAGVPASNRIFGEFALTKINIAGDATSGGSDPAGTAGFGFQLRSNGTNYTIDPGGFNANEGGAAVDTGIAVGGAIGLSAKYTENSATSTTMEVFINGSGTAIYTQTLGTAQVTGADVYAWYNTSSGTGLSPVGEVQFSSLGITIVPEPSIALLGGLGLLGLLRRRR